MTQAPLPGAAADQEQLNAAKMVMTITVRGQAVTLAPLNLPFAEELLVRKATGLPWTAFFTGGETAVGMDTIKVAWWLGRRAGGEWQLTLERAMEEWPEDISPDDLDVQIADPEGNDPEV